MKTRTIRQTVRFQATRRQVYDMIVDPKKHQSLSGKRASNSKKVGGKFTAWGPYISGFNLVLKPGEKIVQAWRANEWLPDHNSIVIFDTKKVQGGSELQFTQIGVPPDFESMAEPWPINPTAFFEQATIHMDGTLVGTTGAYKEGMAPQIAAWMALASHVTMRMVGLL